MYSNDTQADDTQQPLICGVTRYDHYNRPFVRLMPIKRVVLIVGRLRSSAELSYAGWCRRTRH